MERGNIFGYNNLVVDPLNFQILKEQGNPVFFDVTHFLQQPMLEKSTGGRQYVFELAKAGISQNIAGFSRNPSRSKQSEMMAHAHLNYLI